MNFFKLVQRAIMLSVAPVVFAETPVEYHAEAFGNYGKGNFAPYYIASNRHGTLTQTKDAILGLGLYKGLDYDRRFSFGFGLEAFTGVASHTVYSQYNEAGKLVGNPQRPPSIWLQQLYGEVRYRSLFLTAGMKQHESALLNFRLSSGDYIESGNSRPVPQIRAGFSDFQDVPFTNGVLQIQGELAFGKFADGDWLLNHSNHNEKVTTGALYHYKRAYFRLFPKKPFTATFGMQTAAQINGTIHRYSNGKLTSVEKSTFELKDLWKMFAPGHDRITYYDGNSLGSWDIMLQYSLHDGTLFKGYLQHPWEDGSGIGFQNCFDGIWGLEYQASDCDSYISGVVIEYLDFTNQTGPIHWDPVITPGTTLGSHTSGADNYYNNGGYNGWANYGMSIGTPVIVSPLYNLNGGMRFQNNRIRGFHIGVEGRIISGLRYRLLGGYRKGWGTYSVPYINSRETTSMMAELCWIPDFFNKVSLKGQFAFDKGEFYGDNHGVMFSITYKDSFLPWKK